MQRSFIRPPTPSPLLVWLVARMSEQVQPHLPSGWTAAGAWANMLNKSGHEFASLSQDWPDCTRQDLESAFERLRLFELVHARAAGQIKETIADEAASNTPAGAPPAAAAMALAGRLSRARKKAKATGGLSATQEATAKNTGPTHKPNPAMVDAASSQPILQTILQTEPPVLRWRFSAADIHPAQGASPASPAPLFSSNASVDEDWPQSVLEAIARLKSADTAWVEIDHVPGLSDFFAQHHENTLRWGLGWWFHPPAHIRDGSAVQYGDASIRHAMLENSTAPGSSVPHDPSDHPVNAGTPLVCRDLAPRRSMDADDEGWSDYRKSLARITTRMISTAHHDQWVWPCTDLLLSALQARLLTGHIRGNIAGWKPRGRWLKARQAVWEAARSAWGSEAGFDEMILEILRRLERVRAGEQPY